MTFGAAIATLKDRGGPGSKPVASESTTVGLTTRAPAEATPTAPVQVKVSGVAAKIAAAAAEVADKVSLTDDEVSLVESSGIMSQEACAWKAPWTAWRQD